MPIAAVPRYLPPSDFAKASPALRFGLLLSIWTDRSDQRAAGAGTGNEKKAREAEQLRHGPRADEPQIFDQVTGPS